MTPSIPPEIWIHVSKFIPPNDLRDLLRVNSTFFQLAMEARYRDVSFMWFDDATMRKMRRLRDPAVARLVRNLHVNPWFSQEAVTQYMRSRFFTTHRAAYRTSLKEVVQTMVDTVAHLTAVTSFSVEWLDLPSPERLSPFLAAAWSAFGPRLRSVALKTEPGNLRALLSTAGGRDLAALASLHVELVAVDGHGGGGSSSAPGPGGETGTLVTHLAPFINRIAPTLRTLSLASSGETTGTELAPLFCALGCIPNLERLDLADDPHRACGLSDPRGLTRLLRDHASTLRHVRWIGQGATKSDDGDNDDGDDDTGIPPPPSAHHRDDDPYTGWLEHIQREPCILANLTTLELAVPRRRSARGRELMVACIRRSAATLTALVLSGDYLAVHEACAVASAFVLLAAPADADAATTARDTGSCRLEALRMPVQVLSVDLLAHLAQTLPTLDRLGLDVKYVRGSASSSLQKDVERRHHHHHRAHGGGGVPADDDVSRVQDFVARLGEEDSLSKWRLRDISISVGGSMAAAAGRKKRWVDPTLVKAIVDVLPSVQRCCGVERRDLVGGGVYGD